MDFFKNISPFVRQVKIRKDHSLSGEWLDYDNVFTYIEEGEADFILNGVTYRLKEGDVIIMPPTLVHIINSDNNSPFVQYIFHFDFFFDKEREKLVSNITDPTNIQIKETEMYFAVNYFVARLNQSERHRIRSLFLSMFKEFIEKKMGYEIFLKAIAIEILGIYMRSETNCTIKSYKNAKSWMSIEKAIKYIHENYFDSELDNIKISEAAELSPNYLSNIFREQMGFRVHEYINHVRIEKAKKLILENKKNFSEIAVVLGFSSIHTFSKIFKKTTGVNPSEFIKINISKTDSFDHT